VLFAASDLLHGIAPLAVLAGLVVHLLGEPDLLRPELRLLPAGPAARPAAARASMVRSDISACSNQAIAPRIWKNIRPAAVVVVSMPWPGTTRSTPRRWSSPAISIRCARPGRAGRAW
jgi:hypothetical protein